MISHQCYVIFYIYDKVFNMFGDTIKSTFIFQFRVFIKKIQKYNLFLNIDLASCDLAEVTLKEKESLTDLIPRNPYHL